MADIVYHYTTAEALLNMVEEGRIRLRATNCDYLNDPTERLHVLKVLNRYLPVVEKELNIDPQGCIAANFKILDSPKNKHKILRWINDWCSPTEAFYITCFSNCADSLPMWNMYAQNGGGIAIGIDKSYLKKQYNLDDVLYCDETSKNHIVNALKIFYSTFLKNERDPEKKVHNLINGFGLLLKNGSYAYEEESRIIKIERIHSFAIKYRTRGGIIIPYVDNIEIPADKIIEFIIGPTLDFELAKRSMYQFLSIKRITHCSGQIKQSSVPYRV